MAEFDDLRRRACELRKLFAESETRSTGHAWSRADLVRGFVGDVGALAKLSMAADGVRQIPDYKAKLGHEFADCLWSILVLADAYEVDLEAEFQKLIETLSARLAGNSPV